VMKRILSVCVAGILIAGSAAAQEYVIGGGDVLQVSVWDVPQFSGQVVVRPDGMITLPAVGDIQAAGSTPTSLAQKIKKTLKGMVHAPVVTLTVVQVTNNRIYVAGGGVPSEVVPMTTQISLFQFLCRFNSFDEADLKRAYLMRNGKKIKSNFEGLTKGGDLSGDIDLEPDDIVFIPNYNDNRVYVVGAVNQPRYISYRTDMTVLDAILEAGGFTQFADQGEVRIIRNMRIANGSFEKIELEADIEDLLKGKDLKQNIHLEPGDYVNVKEGMF